MFTSEPPLSQRIERMIERTPIVDPHTHIRCDRPSAPDLASLMSYHWVKTELLAVGMPEADLDPALPPDERVRRSIPFLRRMRNTAMAWCFYRILRDLYDFHDPHITESNYREICDKVEASGKDPQWPLRVLRDRCNVRWVVTSLGNKSADESKNPDFVSFMLDAHYLFCPGVATDLEPFFVGRTRKAEYGNALFTLLGNEWPTSSERMERVVGEWLDRTVTGKTTFTNTFIPIEQRFGPIDESRVSAALNRGPGDPDMADADVDALSRFVSRAVLRWHHDHKKAVQIAVGAEYFICDGKSIPRFQETWTSEMARSFHEFRARGSTS